MFSSTTLHVITEETLCCICCHCKAMAKQCQKCCSFQVSVLALTKGRKELALGRSYHLAKRTQTLCERELTWHLHRAGVCRFISACRGHGEESLITETTTLSPPSWAQVLWRVTRCSVFCSYPVAAGPCTVGMEKQGCRVTVVWYTNSHTLHFPGAEAVLLRGTGSLYAQLSLCVSMP